VRLEALQGRAVYGVASREGAGEAGAEVSTPQSGPWPIGVVAGAFEQPLTHAIAWASVHGCLPTDVPPKTLDVRLTGRDRRGSLASSRTPATRQCAASSQEFRRDPSAAWLWLS